MAEVDVVIIGAGPAGSSAAATLGGESFIRVLIIEKDPHSSKNLTPLSFSDVPALFGLDESVLERYSSLTYIYPGRKEVSFNYEHFPFVALDYRKACGLLREKAVSGGRVDLVRGEVASLSREKGGITIGLQDGTEVTSRFLIDASGRAHAALKALDLRFEGYYSHAIGYFLEVEEDIEKPLAVFLSPHSSFGNGGGWLYTIGRHHVSFGYAVVRKFPEYPARALEKIFQDAKSAYSKIFPFLRHARALHAERGSIPINPVNGLVHGRIVLTGDAAALATNWMCMGMEPALWSGQVAAGAVRQALKETDEAPLRLNAYQAQWEKKYGPAYRDMAAFSQAFWTFKDSMWEFILSCDLGKLKPEQFLERMKKNAHRMTRGTFSRRYLLYRLSKPISGLFGRGSQGRTALRP